MAKRIAYTKQKDGTKKSKEYYSIRYKTRYYVILDEVNKSYRIVNVNKKRTVAQDKGNINNINVLKRNAKSALEKLGVEFSTELRDRDYFTKS